MHLISNTENAKQQLRAAQPVGRMACGIRRESGLSLMRLNFPKKDRFRQAAYQGTDLHPGNRKQIVQPDEAVFVVATAVIAVVCLFVLMCRFYLRRTATARFLCAFGGFFALRLRRGATCAGFRYSGAVTAQRFISRAGVEESRFQQPLAVMHADPYACC